MSKPRSSPCLRPCSSCERRRWQGLSLWQRLRLVVVIAMTALVVAEISLMPFVTNFAPLIPAGDRPSPTANEGRWQGLSLWQRQGLVAAFTTTALVVAEISFMPFVAIFAPLIPVGDSPSPTGKGGISRVCPSGSGQDWFS